MIAKKLKAGVTNLLRFAENRKQETRNVIAIKYDILQAEK